jgi:competence protein ComGC
MNAAKKDRNEKVYTLVTTMLVVLIIMVCIVVNHTKL